jgi:hypothetical protein
LGKVLFGCRFGLGGSKDEKATDHLKRHAVQFRSKQNMLDALYDFECIPPINRETLPEPHVLWGWRGMLLQAVLSSGVIALPLVVFQDLY